MYVSIIGHPPHIPYPTLFIIMETNIIPDQVKKVIDFVVQYVDTSTSDWIRVKKELLINLPPPLRSLFSRRHKTSKKHFLNQMELDIIKEWQALTGVLLVIEDDKLHRDSDEKPPRYWHLKEINKKRKQEAIKRKKLLVKGKRNEKNNNNK